MGRGTRYYSLEVFLAIVDAFVSARVDVRTYLLDGAIDGSETNGIICNPKLELESSRFTFDLVPLRVTMVRVGLEHGKLVVGSVLYFLDDIFNRNQSQGGVRVALLKMIVESLKEEKMYVKSSNNVEAEQKRKLLDVARKINEHAWKREKVIACTSRQLKVLMKDCMANVRDVRTLAIEEAYTTKYSIHPRADTMLCSFRLTNRWLSMKKDIASCGSKYLAYLEVEFEYQGSSRLLLQPELPE
ncbi:hypothetical protein Tco_0010456 [Tanacetum coccineum]